jgi:hypothetical protein
MHFRRSSPSDERRRRLLNEELAQEAVRHASSAGEARSVPASPPPNVPRYAEAARREHQPRIVDLIPQRKLVLLAVFALGLLVIVGLGWLYCLMPRLSPWTHDGKVAAFDLDAEGSLGTWFSSFLLTVSAGVACIVYSLRRHRVDDYRGAYRIWIWAALVWFLMAIDEAGSLHEGFKELMALVIGLRLSGDGSLWWVLAYGLVLAVVGTGLLLEMRECRSSSAALLAAGGSYALAVAVQLEWLMPHSGARGILVEECAEMVGDLLVLMAMMLHARYVLRDIEGLVPVRAPARGELVGVAEDATRGGRSASRRRRAEAVAAEAGMDDSSRNVPTVQAAAAAASAPVEQRLRSPAAVAPAATAATRQGRDEAPLPVSPPVAAPTGPSMAARPAPQQEGLLRTDSPHAAGGAERLSKAQRKAERRRRRLERRGG